MLGGMEKLVGVAVLVNSFIFCYAILDLNGTHEMDGTWKSSATLQCIYMPSENFQQQTVVWTMERDNIPVTVFRRDDSGDHILLSRYRDRVRVPKFPPGDVSLQIEKLEIPDSGHYTCKVTWRTQNDSLITKEMTTTMRVVKVAVSKPIITPGHLGLTVPEGARASLTCSARGSPPISYQWFKGEPGGSAVHLSNQAKLVFDPMQNSDAGQYYCQAENRARSLVTEQSDVVQLTVRETTTTVLGTEATAHTTTKPIFERDLSTTVDSGNDVERKILTGDLGARRTGLPLYLIIPIAVLCAIVLVSVIAVILCRRKNKNDHLYDVTYRNCIKSQRRETCSRESGGCLYEEVHFSVENNYVPDPVEKTDLEKLSRRKSAEYETLVKSMESEYEVGGV
ncbi:PREDICTED: V-set and immunoglobulin domain-containing protein 4 isoform X1 [Gavialis gangeticus]|uniref:V-set and immunoglobulin domain-containing protein 4 isoform X1 n=1 Tax=Gavialis gangeticus TaxID=94835 RepID=UPI00092E9334|nr:PREDICTED: V-set and immunoglobulin domain-containing protein 4 isoform X1 [Gavialis gangeticus]